MVLYVLYSLINYVYVYNRLAHLNKDSKLHGYSVGQLVYLYNPRGALLQTGSRKIKCE